MNRWTVVFVAFVLGLAGCDRNAPSSSSGSTGTQPAAPIEIRLTKDTMEGQEVVVSNEIVTVKVKGLYQQMFSGDWQMGIKVVPLRNLSISKIRSESFNGQKVRLRGIENVFVPPAGDLRQGFERQIDVSFKHPTSSMLVTLVDQAGQEVTRIEITQIVDYLISNNLLPAENRAIYDNSQP